MNGKLQVPQQIVVGQQKRSDTYTGRLGYVIYKDEKGVLRKQTSWEGWRDKSIEPCYYENKPTEGFVLNRHGGGHSHSRYSDYYGRAAFIRVYDPRDFEFEISLENLLFILRYADCSRGKGLEGKFVYGWNGKDLVLLPEGCPEYKEALEYTSLKSMKVSTKELVPGYTYYSKDQEDLIYLGKFNAFETTRYGSQLSTFKVQHIFYRGSQTFEEYMEKIGYGQTYWEDMKVQYAKNHESSKLKGWNTSYYTPEAFQEQKDNQYKYFYDQYINQKYVALAPTKLAKLIDTNVVPNYAELIDDLQNSGRIMMFERIETKPKTFNYDSTNDSWYNGREYFSGYLKIGEDEYKRVAIHAVAQSKYSYTYSYGKLLGFQLRELYTLKITDKGIIKKAINQKEPSETIIPKDGLNSLDFYDLIIKFNENKVLEIA